MSPLTQGLNYRSACDDALWSSAAMWLGSVGKKHPLPSLSRQLARFFEIERRHTKQRERLFNVTTISFTII